MKMGVSTGALVADVTVIVDARQSQMQTVGGSPIGMNVADGCLAVRWIIVARGAVI